MEINKSLQWYHSYEDWVAGCLNFQQEKFEFQFPEPIRKDEIPKSLSMCGWMRNEREAIEMWREIRNRRSSYF